ncbi:holo-ACP synthase [Aminivibrio sp.]|uniref:holo-ACP synthase n=1 Tax=Aminivibrio sp. TaxID=1872489 RepID=UPI001A500762|nr:holo-ACP synthase [Aminivibrio sp.]MBL3538641.1 holo-ACP synthase [Aminivibrio sp.]
MIVGLGVDLCNVERIRKSMRSDHFVKRVFHPDEIAYAFSKADPARHLAGSFAAREAFSKASSVSMYSIAFCGVWVERTESGPVLRIGESVRHLIPGGKTGSPFLSVSHDGEYAVAVVVIEANHELLHFR